MERIIKSSRYPGDEVLVTGRHSSCGYYVYVACVDAARTNVTHLHLSREESRKLRKALKAAERGD